MLRKVGYGTKLVRDYNELNILRFIKLYGPLSRAQLSKKYKISKATVSEIITKLMEVNFVKEIGMGKSTKIGGRKPILLEFNPKAGFAIGIEIKRDHARVALTDLNAHIYKQNTIEYPENVSLTDVLVLLFPLISDYLKETWVKSAKPMGIGVSIPGLIDYKKGCILESDSLKEWEGVLIKKIFEKEFGIETFIENDVKAITFGESRFGNGRNYNNMIYLWVGDGIGAGIVINGELYRGVSASAGEVGFYELGYYIQNEAEFKWLYNGHKTFGDILSEKVLIEGACKGIRENFETGMKENELSIETIMDKALEDDPLALELIKEYAGIVGILCINLINTLNPEILLIGGDHLAYNTRLMEYIRERVKKDELHTPILAVKIQNAGLKDVSGVLGSVGLVLDDIFYSEQLNLGRYRAIFGKS
ncbi:MAG: ROK family transcriptional regulator [Calditrichaeota bacterium]|nr:MAG: ROK family transcriptional regulator [Calditrichota bacterium]MBL1204252.1 ROK family transcriptional regulator [Calditrichota bacterium]NOG44082.1 ROK family transcriptional regulator [Calditrichota bacterium]